MEQSDPEKHEVLLMESSPLHKRAVILMFFLFLWAALVAARLFYFTVVARGEYLAAGERLSMRTGVVPAMRGRILDGKGAVLAWSERRVDLRLTAIPSFAPRRERLERGIREIIPDFSISSSEEGIILKSDISPEEQVSLFHFVSKFREIAFVNRVVRKTVDGVLGKQVGAVVKGDGSLRGISGYERSRDRELRGRDGKFQVMVDRTGRWIPGTWRELMKPVNGKDVVLSSSQSQ